ncbi:SLBB domain-containing protein [Parasediminibacterium sp. JCM 36343]|uniref:SLBB domain-containing protein n=1 Tax=Parasediminibacterium sp. JCM 36343 TaxID=3374279 RepID=UPI003978DEA0
MNKMFLYKVFAAFLCCVISTKMLCAQDILKSKDLSTFKVDVLTDDDINKFKQQIQQSGLTETQAEQLALQRGLPTSELSKLRARLASTSNNKNTSITSKAISRALDTTDFVASTTTYEKETRNTVFGSELFNNPTPIFEPNLRIATPKNYSLGPDDELIIDVFGYQEANYRLTVSPEGSINIPFIGIVPVTGLTIEQATKRIKTKMMGSGYASMATGQTELQVSIGKIRSIKVTVIGDAKKPGSYNISSLSTLFNALYAAGGPSGKGSFRQIELIRNNKIIVKLDAYDFLLKGDQTNNVRLSDQDVIRIPPADVQVSLLGEVKREGIFEILPNESLQKLIGFSGGFGNEAYTASVQIKQVTEKERRIKDVLKNDFSTYVPAKGDSIQVNKILNRYDNKVTISGAVYRPGTYELKKGYTLAQLIEKADGLKQDAFKERGEIVRINDTDLTKKIIPFNVQAVVAKTATDIPLQKNDEVIIGEAGAYKEKYTISLEGEVKKPGLYPYFDGITLNDLLFLAEGLTDASAIDHIEIARRVKSDNNTKKDEMAIIIDVAAQKDLSVIGNETQLQPWDVIAVRRKKDYREQVSVKVEGEVKYPGNYILSEKDEHVSNLLKRAGGITNEAFIEAASLIRVNNTLLKNNDMAEEKVKKIQQQLKDTSSNLVEGYTKPTIKVGLDLSKILSNPRGLDDILLQEGDVLSIPKQKNEIKVNGEVMVPSEVVYKKGESLKYYINKAGGYTDNAREKKVYVLYANGDANRIKHFLFFKTYPVITPGSEILVPKIPERKANGLSTAEVIGLTSAIASLAGVVIAILRR